MHKELLSIKMIRDYLEQKGIIKNTSTNIDDIFGFFNYLANPKSNKKFNSLYILNYLNQYLVCQEVAKRKTSARIFEDLISIIFNGMVADNKIRKNLHSNVPEYFELVKDKVAGNKREKVDILFNNGDYGISLKTLMLDNFEINLGSFEKNVLFDGFGVNKYLNERKNADDVGLGSIPRLRKLLNIMDSNGYYAKFIERFTKMFKFIFSDDIILAVKDTDKLHIYFLKGEEFSGFITKNVENIDVLLSLINRWEGNSIRINRKKILDQCTRKVTLDLSSLDKTVINLINKFDYELHKMYVEYFNLTENSNIKNKLLKSLETLFKEFDKNIVELK